jgi:hypothetical protein
MPAAIKTIKRKRGRPKHATDPPKLFSTTIPMSVYGLLQELSERLERPKSEVLTEAIRAYAHLHIFLRPM